MNLPPRDQVLITRPAAEAGATAALIAGRGLVPVLAPLMVVRGLPLRVPGNTGAVLVTSGNALASLAASAIPRDATLLAVGDRTAQRAREAGFTAVESADGDAADLVALARRTLPPGCAILLATGRGQGGALTAALRAAGFRVHRRAAYAAVPVGRLPAAAGAALQGGRLRAALFLSAETARTFVRLLPAASRPALTGVDALAIGQPAADALTLLPWNRVRVSVAPTLDQVLALL